MSEQTNVTPFANVDASLPTGAIAPVQVAKVDKPAGGLTVVDTDNATQIDLGFDLGDGVKVLALDVDLVIAFPDGTKVILPNLGMKLAGVNAPKLSVLGHAISKQLLLAQISDVSLAASHDMLAPPTPTQSQSTTPDSQPQTSQTPAPQAQAATAAVDVGPGQSAKIVSTKVADAEPHTDNQNTSNNPPAPIVPTTVQLNTSATPAPTPSKSQTTVAKSDLIEGTITAALYNYDTTTRKTLVAGGYEIDGAPGGAATSTSKTFTTQAATRSLSGSDAADLIYADAPSLESVGHSIRLMKGDLAITAGTITSIQVQGLPAGVTSTGLTYAVGTTDKSQATFSLALNYAIPQDGAAVDAQGFFSKFTLSFFITYNDGVQDHTALVTQEVGIRAQTGTDDTQLTDKATGNGILVLWANPPGANVDAGNGDDTVVSGAGADTLHGGAGINTLSYERSQGGVTVNLGAHAASGGFAKGDVFDGFQNVIGSAFNDSISGDSGDNTLAGGAGADTLVGGGGHDTADYTASSVGVSVDLGSSGAQHGGDAEGDVLVGIANVTGSATAANTLHGSTGGNVITGGAGNDSIDGGGGADVINAGAGDDTIVTYGNESLIDGGAGNNMLVLASGVSVDLSGATKIAYVTGVSSAQIVNIESIDASSHTGAVTIVGDSQANVIYAGSGNDSLDGNGGRDGVYGGSGDDTIVYHGDEGRLDGGDGNDTLKIAAGVGATVDLGAGTDQTSNDTAIVVNFENVDGSATSSSLVITGSSGNNSIVGGAGADSIVTSMGVLASGNDTIVGGGGNDTILAGGGNDSISTSSGNASIDGGGGNDVIHASGGNDTVVYHGTEALITANSYTASTLKLTTNLQQVNLTQSDETQDTEDGTIVSGFNNLDASALTQGILVVGSSADNTIVGGLGDDTVALLGGDSALPIGHDSLDGGAGVNTLDLSDMVGTVAVNLSTVAQNGAGALQGVALTDFQNVRGSSHVGNVITGSLGDNSIQGGNFGNTIDGAGGSDSITGGAGNDLVYFYGSEGSIIGNGGSDTLVVEGSADDFKFDLTNSSNQLTYAVNGHLAVIQGFSSVVYTVSTSGGSDSGSGGSGGTSGGNGDGDYIYSSGPNNIVYYQGTEVAITGNLSANNTLRLKAPVNIDLSATGATNGTDQTVGDRVNVTGFQNVDASYLSLSNMTAGNPGEPGVTFSGVKITGSSASNVLTGSFGNDTFVGSLGGDVISGGGGHDLVDYSQITGSVTVNLDPVTGRATLPGNNFDKLTSIDNVIGSAAGHNLLTGSTNANDIEANANSLGYDTIVGTSGNDTIVGHGAHELIDYSNATSAVTLDLTQQGVQNSTGFVGNSSISGISDVIGASGFVNILTGTTGDNSLRGGNLADTLDGGGGNDTIGGGAGADVITYHGTEGVIDGGAETNPGLVSPNTLVIAADALVNKPGLAVDLSNSLDQTSGDATFTLNFQNIDASAATATLSLKGDSGANVIDGTNHGDSIDGNGGNDSIIGGTGNDSIIVHGTEGRIDAGAGIDTMVLASTSTFSVDLSQTISQIAVTNTQVRNFENIDATNRVAGSALTGSTEANLISGSSHGDTIDGDGGADTILGGSGNDRISYHGTEATISGGGGNDTLVLSTDADVDLSHTPSQVLASIAGVSSGLAVPAVTGFMAVDASSRSSGLHFYGDGNANSFIGGSGNDTFYGSAANDTIDGGGGSADLVNYTNSPAAVSINLSLTGAQPTAGDGGGDVLRNIENVTGSSNGHNTLIGDTNANVLTGGAGGFDSLTGGGGADTLIGASPTSNVTASYASSIGVSVDLGRGSGAQSSPGDANGDVLINIQNVVGSSTGANTLTGDTNSNYLTGGAVGDVLNDGGPGNPDTMEGGAGDDIYYVHNAGDVIKENAGGGNDSVYTDIATLTLANYANVEGLVYIGSANYTLTGDTGANYLSGAGALSNGSIDGDGGNDTLIGGAGADTLVMYGNEGRIDGGTGTADTLKLAAASTTVTTVDLSLTDLHMAVGVSTQVTGF